LQVVLSVVGVLMLLGFGLSSRNSNAGRVDYVVMTTWWVYAFIMSEITVIALCRLDGWLRWTEVDMDYITYQTCIRECSQYADRSVDIARVNQCEDRGVSCGGALSEGAVVSCRSCQSHRTDWYDLVIFGGFLKGLAIYHWVVFFLYTIAIKTSRTWHRGVIWATLLPPLGAFIACAILTSRMALCGVYGLSAYFTTLGVPSIYDIGLGWTLCMGIWWAVFCLGKCVSSGQKECEGHAETAASLVFRCC
jgi:hypothetical protein